MAIDPRILPWFQYFFEFVLRKRKREIRRHHHRNSVVQMRKIGFLLKMLEKQWKSAVNSSLVVSMLYGYLTFRDVWSLFKPNHSYLMIASQQWTPKRWVRHLRMKKESMRWKADFFLHGNDNSTRTQPTNTYGFKTRRSALYVADLKPFEDDLAKLLENVKFRNVNDEFIKTLEKDKRKINSSNNVFIFADKTRNIYEMEAKSYDKLLTQNVTVEKHRLHLDTLTLFMLIAIRHS